MDPTLAVRGQVVATDLAPSLSHETVRPGHRKDNPSYAVPEVELEAVLKVSADFCSPSLEDCSTFTNEPYAP